MHWSLTPGLRKTRGNLDDLGGIQKMKNSLRVELLSSNAAIYYIKHLDSHCIFTTVLGTLPWSKKARNVGQTGRGRCNFF